MGIECSDKVLDFDMDLATVIAMCQAFVTKSLDGGGKEAEDLEALRKAAQDENNRIAEFSAKAKEFSAKAKEAADLKSIAEKDVKETWR